jgi:hypothetical protein
VSTQLQSNNNNTLITSVNYCLKFNKKYLEKQLRTFTHFSQSAINVNKDQQAKQNRDVCVLKLRILQTKRRFLADCKVYILQEEIHTENETGHWNLVQCEIYTFVLVFPMQLVLSDKDLLD